MTGTKYPNCDFSPIGNEYLLKHGFFSLLISMGASNTNAAPHPIPLPGGERGG
jgi:hypothetical protein